jgi:hypothetical protein
MLESNYNEERRARVEAMVQSLRETATREVVTRRIRQVQLVEVRVPTPRAHIVAARVQEVARYVSFRLFITERVI